MTNCLHVFLQESHEQCVQWIVRFIHSQHSPKRISFLYDCLAMAVETSLLPPRYTHTLTHLIRPTDIVYALIYILGLDRVYYYPVHLRFLFRLL